jgi:hypothetical protein
MVVETPLCALARKYGTDKGGRPEGHHYTQHYYDLLHLQRTTVEAVLEIGICGNRNIPFNRTGASLFMWQEFFPYAAIYGLDNDPKWLINIGNITTALADQGDPISLNAALDFLKEDQFDVIVDDGSHRPDHQVISMQTLLPHLRPTGIYFIEDVACAPNDITRYLPPEYETTVFPEKMVKQKDQFLIAIKRRAPH